MPTFKAPGSSLPPTPDNSQSIFSNVSTTPGGQPSMKPSLFSGVDKSQPARRSLFNESINSNSSTDDLFAWPGSAKKPAAKKDTASKSDNPPSLFSGNTLFGGHTPAKPKFGLHPNLLDDDDEMQEAGNAQDEGMTDVGGPELPDFGRSLFDKSTVQPQPVTTFTSHGKFPPPRPEDRKPTQVQKQPQTSPRLRVVPRKVQSPLPAIAKDTANSSPLAAINEPTSLLLGNEDAISQVYEHIAETDLTDEELQDTLSGLTSRLLKLWDASLPPTDESRTALSIGPGGNSPDPTKAKFLASLLLPLHHPPTIKENDDGMSRLAPRVPFQSLILAKPEKKKASIPKVLLDWLDTYHSPRPDIVDALKDVSPNQTASPTFWQVINYLVLRAQFTRVIQLLDTADFSVARSSLEDGYESPGYRGSQLQNIQKVVKTAVRTLRHSPSINGNWDILSIDWTMYRKQVQGAIGELDMLAEMQNVSPENPRFKAPTFGVPQQHASGISFTQAARMADSKLPLTIYQRLKEMYRIILGDVEAVLGNAQDWVEATVGLTCWWDGEDEGEDATKDLFAKSTRLVDDDPREGYLKRLRDSYASVTGHLADKGDGTSFEINSLDPIEVGLASVFEGDLEGVLRLMQIWSQPIAAATAEVAAFGGWYDVQKRPTAMPGLSETDLMVLNYGQDDGPLQKDDVLIDYATSLFELGRLEGDSESRESWESALEVLGRLDDQRTMKEKVSELIDRIPLDTTDQMDRVVLLCTELGFLEQGRKVSERYGDKIAETSEEYGTALLCYARAHCHKKIKNVVDLLTSFCLVRSMAYPDASDLDEQLRTLLYDPKTAFNAVASIDEEGARILNFYFCGYAAVRRFYEIRDEGMSLQKGEKPRHRPLARKKAAAETLVALIRSAADCIYGGLYDHEREAAVQVDGLLVLLGEALVFTSEPNRFLTSDQQYDILAAIEDLQTVTRRVYDQCEECLQATLYHHFNYDDVSAQQTTSRPASPEKPNFSFSISKRDNSIPTQSLLSKSISTAAPFSGFSLIGNEMLGNKGDGGVSEANEPTERANEVRREWDWRTGIQKGATGEDILRILRLQLAKGLSFGALSY